jgi:FkbM family methyltransferase
LQVARILGHPIIERIDNGLAIILYPAEGYSRPIHYFRFNKPFIARFYEAFLTDGMVYVDCGANIGLYSMLAAKKVGQNGAVFSFEPQPDIFHRLLANIHLNHLTNVHAHCVALADQAGEVELVQMRDHVASYVKPLQSNVEASSRCEATTLDCFFHDDAIRRLDMLKIDVEGYELKVLEGAQGLIERLRPTLIQFEYYSKYPLLPRAEWPTLDKFILFFERMGYEGFFCVGRRSCLLEPLVEEDPQDNDLFCVDRSRMQESRQLFSELPTTRSSVAP